MSLLLDHLLELLVREALPQLLSDALQVSEGDLALVIFVEESKDLSKASKPLDCRPALSISALEFLSGILPFIISQNSSKLMGWEGSCAVFTALSAPPQGLADVRQHLSDLNRPLEQQPMDSDVFLLHLKAQRAQGGLQFSGVDRARTLRVEEAEGLWPYVQSSLGPIPSLYYTYCK